MERETLVSKEGFTCILADAWKEPDAVQKMMAQEYSNANNLRDYGDRGINVWVQNILFLEVENENSENPNYEAMYVIAEEDVYYTTSQSCIDWIRNLIEKDDCQNANEVLIHFQLRDSKSRKNVQFLSAGLRGLR